MASMISKYGSSATSILRSRPLFVRPGQMASILRISREHLHEITERGEIPSFKVKSWRYYSLSTVMQSLGVSPDAADLGFYTTAELCDLLGRSPETIYDMIRTGRIPCVKVARKYLFEKKFFM
jgi:excisionase family DNA binding protein